MQRLREMLAHGGIAILAVVFSLALAAIAFANAVAQQLVSVLEQATVDRESGTGGLVFTVHGTDVEYALIVQAAIVVAIVATGLGGLWLLTRPALRTCPECRSEVPRRASICRYCTTDLPATDA